MEPLCECGDGAPGRVPPTPLDTPTAGGAGRPARKSADRLRARPLRLNTYELQPYRRRGSSVGTLPRDAERHWRGIWHIEEGRVYGRFTKEDCLLPEYRNRTKQAKWLEGECWALCHCKPMNNGNCPPRDESRFPDIPDRLDIFFLLVTQFHAIAFNGRRCAAVIRRTSETEATLARLEEWLGDKSRGRYRRSRGRAQLRKRWRRMPSSLDLDRQFARSALRALGLRWPGKPSDRERMWPDCLRELGLSVELAEAPAFVAPKPRKRRSQG